ERISQLIAQLGSNRFKDREGAAAALNTIGEPALEALRKAVHDRDPEIGRRAEILANCIRKRVETAQILQPKQVHLTFNSIPVTQAAAEFARQSGFGIELRETPAHSFSAITGIKVHFETDLRQPTLRTLDPRITLDTGETTFWEALDRFCNAV